MTDLAHVLRHIPRYDDPRLLIGEDVADDAAVYQVRDDLALVQTVDFFTPIVDDPYTFGQIAAANSLSDVYAVGGDPLTALNIVAFPVKTLDADILSDILRGGADKAHEAGVTVVGGHTVEDEEPKYGLAVTGTVDPRRMITARAARPGDMLVLTKPLGTGVIATATKAQAATEEHVAQAVRWMTTLNRGASEAMLQVGARAATDITGYGLLGHLADFCRASRLGASIQASAVPLLPGALEYARQGYVPGGTGTNLTHVQDDLEVDRAIDDLTMRLLADPQTSGGLLVALERQHVATFQEIIGPHGLASVIGSFHEQTERRTLQIVP